VLGISSGVDKDLVKQLSFLGNGNHDFVIDPSKIEEVTMKL